MPNLQQNNDEAGRIEEDGVADDLDPLRRFTGSPSDFWPAFLEGFGRFLGARSGTLVMRRPDEPWRPLAHLGRRPVREGDAPDPVADRAVIETVVVEPASGRGGGEDAGSRWSIDVTPAGSEIRFVAVLRLAPSAAVGGLEETEARARIGREVASVYTLRRRLGRLEHDIASFASVLDLLRILDGRPRFLEAAMTVCNESASRFGCERVSLGWLEGGEVRLQAISHSEKFEKKAGVVRALEAVMEESLDQDVEIAVPPPGEEGDDAVTRLHEDFARDHSAAHLASVPIRSGGSPVGVLTLERASAPFDEAALLSLRLLGDQIASRLVERKRRDRWIGARWWAATRERAAGLVGVEHTGWKLVGLITAIALGVLVFGRGTYRVEAPFILEADQVAQLPAAFEGYIQEVHFRVGDAVAADAPLVQLDVRELLVEETEILAEIRRHRSEVQRAENAGELAEMRIATASAEQAEARLEAVRHQLSRGLVRAPFDGVVVEGDLRERIGAPVPQGEVLLRIARLDALHVESRVDEGDIHLLSEGAAGEVAFASRPNRTFPVVVERVEPLALPEEGGNVFVVRSSFPEGAEAWWRPGMSGLCKIEAGRRSFLWMLTRRTVDFLRLRFWW